MADEPTTTGNPTSPQGEAPPLSASPPASLPSSPEPTTAPAATLPSPGTAGDGAPSTEAIPEEHIARYLEAHPELHEKFFEAKDHDELRKIPAYNKQLARGLQADQKKRDDAAAQERAQQQQFASLDATFRPLHPDANDSDAVRADKAIRLSTVLAQHPDNAAWYGQWQRVKDSGGPAITRTRAEVAGQIVAGLKAAVEADPDQAHLLEQWDEIITSDNDPTKVLATLWETGNRRYRAALETKAQAEAEAKFNELVAKHNLSTDQPATPPGGITGTPDEDAILTGSSSLADKRAAFERKHGIAVPIHI